MPEKPGGDTVPEGYGFEAIPYVPQPRQPPAGQAVSNAYIPPPVASFKPSPPAPGSISLHRRSRRKTWIAFSIACAVLLLSFAGLFVIVNVNRSTPAKTLDAFCTALQNADYHLAYDQFSHKLQRVIPEESFASIFSHDKVTGCSYGATNENGNSATTGLELVHASRGTNTDGITLIKDAKNDWKIDDFFRQ